MAKTNSNDFQNNNIICVLNKKEQLPNPRGRWIDAGKEKMNATSGDEGYNERLAALKAAMKELAVKIQPKVYEYGFLKR